MMVCPKSTCYSGISFANSLINSFANYFSLLLHPYPKNGYIHKNHLKEYWNVSY